MQIAFVLPFYNESKSSYDFLNSLQDEISKLAESASIKLVAVNDGSTDDTLQNLILFQSSSLLDMTILDFQQNYGHERAVKAGIDFLINSSTADGILLMDTDFQDPPEVAILLVQRFIKTQKAIFAKSTERADTLSKKLFANLYYFIQSYFMGSKNFKQVRNFFIIPRTIAEGLSVTVQQMQSNRVNTALLTGKNAEFIHFSRGSRKFGSTHYKFRDSLSLAYDGLLSQPRKISRFANVLLALSILFTLLLSSYLVIFRLVSPGAVVPGVALIILAMSFFATIQITYLNLILSFSIRNYTFSRNLPGYVIRKIYEKN